MAQNWAWTFVFVPVWAVMAALWFSLMSVPKRTATLQMCGWLDSTATVLSIATALSILVGMHCGSLISLPFGDQACSTAAYQLNVWLGH